MPFLTDISMPPLTTPPPSPPMTACQQRAAKERSECGGIGCFITQCNDDGTFPSMQCHGSTGYCHCEDENGNKIAGTDHRPFILTIDCDSKRGEWIMISSPDWCHCFSIEIKGHSTDHTLSRLLLLKFHVKCAIIRLGYPDDCTFCMKLQ